jgi:glycyl-tRNA synthetase beta chain
VARAGRLLKSDLVTRMVGEFPELQGHMGRLYAAAEGEDSRVATAIEEHWWPRFSGDSVPGSPAGTALALADRLDARAATFGIGLAPKGNDPQGLRRAALGLVHTLVRRGVRLDLRHAFGLAIDEVATDAAAEAVAFDRWRAARGDGPTARDRDALVAELVEFTLARQRADATGVPGDIVDAVFSVGSPDPVLFDAKLRAVADLAREADLAVVLQTCKRVAHITRGTSFALPGEGALSHDAERALRRAALEADVAIATAVDRLDLHAAYQANRSLRAPVGALFDAVLVDSPDDAERAARLGLLRAVATTLLRVADFSRISVRAS